MGVEYDRIQRPSIYLPASFGDIPFEVIQKALRLLGRADLVSASLSCRAWRQAAVESIIAIKRFDNERDMGRFVCGMQLKSIVFGFEQYSIKKLHLSIPQIRIEHVRMLSPIVAPTLSSLFLRFVDEDDESDLDCYEIVETFFSSCLQICHLRLAFFDFGDDPSSLTPMIMEGFGRLKSLELNGCRGDLMMFPELAPIQNLSNLTYDLDAIDSSNASDVISMKCRSLKSIVLYARFDSWDCINKIVVCCRDLEDIIIIDYSPWHPLKKSEFAAISSLPCLKSLNLGDCLIDDGDVSPLARCKGLRHLSGDNVILSSDVMREIGGSLLSLQCKLGLDGLEELIKFCPNLEKLDISVKNEEEDDEALLLAEGLIKSGLKKLWELVINDQKVRLGTD
jgi:hypothetical protein